MKVDSISIHFQISMISSRTKHESFDSFGSHAQLLQLRITHGKFKYLFFDCNEPILYSLVIFKQKSKD